jgi:hypothetical protein
MSRHSWTALAEEIGACGGFVGLMLLHADGTLLHQQLRPPYDPVLAREMMPSLRQLGREMSVFGRPARPIYMEMHGEHLHIFAAAGERVLAMILLEHAATPVIQARLLQLLVAEAERDLIPGRKAGPPGDNRSHIC